MSTQTRTQQPRPSRTEEPPLSRTQEQRTAASRALILDAATACLVRDGYQRTTTVAIQEQAGVSRGRLLHHFPSRAALLVAAAQHLASDQQAEMERWVASSTDGRLRGAARIDRATDLLWATLHRPAFVAAMELWQAARTDPELRAGLLDSERRLGRVTERVIAAMYGAELAAHPAFPETRDLLFTSMRGVALSYALTRRDPAADPHLPLWRALVRERLLKPGSNSHA